jgi:hypothetical protein
VHVGVRDLQEIPGGIPCQNEQTGKGQKLNGFKSWAQKRLLGHSHPSAVWDTMAGLAMYFPVIIQSGEKNVRNADTPIIRKSAVVVVKITRKK